MPSALSPSTRLTYFLFLKVSARTKLELEKRENELKERALRNKVIRTRKSSNA
jgi:hypothetical protein